MSVLDSIKGTFHSVQQDFFDGLKALTTLETQSRLDALRRLRTDGVSLDAGADLLNKYQKTWKELQEYTTESARRAENVDSEIGALFVYWDRQVEIAGCFEAEMVDLPNIMPLVSSINSNLAYVQEECKRVEEALGRLEDICEMQEIQRSKGTHILHLAAYRKQKAEEVEKTKVQMAKTHAKAMQIYDDERHVRLKERQEAFNDAFSQDIDYYKTHGHTDRELSVANIPIPKVSSLSDITLEQDDSALNEFLDSAEVTPSKETSGSRLGSSDLANMEGTFIEDDYTTDYNIQSDEDILNDESKQLVSELQETEEKNKMISTENVKDGSGTETEAVFNDQLPDIDSSETVKKTKANNSDNDEKKNISDHLEVEEQKPSSDDFKS